MILLLIFFWAAVAFIAYTYFLFPLLLLVRGLLFRHPYAQADIRPSVSIIIAAHNEAASIAEKLENVLQLDYPEAQLEIVIASDGSDDETNEIVQRYAARGVRLLALPRVGKAEALNKAVASAVNEILVFSDANSQYRPDALQELVRPFADAQVGGVAGNQVYLRAGKGSLTGEGERGYWSFDRRLKVMQSQAGSTTSATGAIYAIRRSLFTPIPEGVTDDFYTSTGVICQGYRLVFSAEAIAYEPVANSAEREFGRKVRVITRGLTAVRLRSQLLNPVKYGFFAIQMLSHKLLRRLVVLPLITILVISPFLWTLHPFYQLVLIGQIAFYGLALLGLALKGSRFGRSKVFSLPFYFCMVNAACLVAISNLLRGRRINRWEPQRNEDAPLSGTVTQTAVVSSSRKQSSS